MKTLAKHLSVFVTILLLGVAFTSCNSDSDDDRPEYVNEFMIIKSDGTNVWFENGNGKYFAVDVPASLKLNEQDGRRALVYYYVVKEKVTPGYDKTIGLMALQLCSMGTFVTDVADAEELETYGKASLSFDNQSYHFSDGWFDILVDYYQYPETEHTFALCVPTPNLIPADAVVPDGYVYMEMRHDCDTDGSKLEKIRDIVSFRVSDEYNPVTNPTVKGYYIKMLDPQGGVNYVTLEFKKQ